MSRLAFYLRTARNNLTRGGQRVLVALLCIAFGVMSLVAMTLLSQSIARTLVIVPSHQIGADMSLSRRSEDYILPEHEADLQALQQAGTIQRYTLVAHTSSLVFFTPGSGEVHFTAAGIGMDPEAYPLAGPLVVGEPGNVGPATLLQAAGDLLVTRDLALESDLEVGDTITLSDLNMGTPVEGRIRGIVNDTPNHQGGKIYYTLATAHKLAGGRVATNTAFANSANPDAVEEQLESSGWLSNQASVLAENQRDEKQLFDLTLKGAGILGLLVGGIGIANTMQVLLRRRRREVAVWKTLGYRARDLQALFATEAALLGTVGSLLGAGLGVAVSKGLVELFRRVGNLLLAWRVSPQVLLAGVLVGILTTVIFAMWAIVITSRVQPLALLRNEAVDARRLLWTQGLGLAAALGLPFLAITSLVMGSLLKGAGVLLFALSGLLILGGLLGSLAWAATRLLSLRSLPLVRMAQKSLRRRGLSLVFAMIALFVGVVSLALGVVVTESAGREMDERSIKVEGYNLTVIAPASQEAALRQAVEAQKVEEFTPGYLTSVRKIRLLGEPGGAHIQPLLVGRQDLHDYTVSGAPWGSEPQGVYTYQPSRIPVGSQVEVTLVDGSTRTLTVVGSYEVEWSAARLPPQLGLLMPAGLSQSLATPDTVLYFVQAQNGQVKRVSNSLGQALPQATVVNLLDYAARYTRVYHNLFVLAVAMGALALLAGVLLVANSVSLAMLDRRYEIGVLKAVGYSRRHVLVTLVIEYTLIALIASAAGLAAVQCFLWILSKVNDLAGDLLVMPLQSAGWIGLCAVGLTLLTVLGVTWQPTRVSPVVVLNDQE